MIPKLPLAALWPWFEAHGRHDLPWQHPRTPYRVWISEIMLQQTTVKTVIPYFQRFMERFPSLSALSQASLEEVLSLWTGLGYYARARNLYQSAQIIMRQYGGEWPATLKEWMDLPGIGPSTAGAILSQAFGIPAVVLDANVRRVFARFYGLHSAPSSDRKSAEKLWALATHNLPGRDQATDYTQALMDLGSLVCTNKEPQCGHCPLNTGCAAAADLSAPQGITQKEKPLATKHKKIRPIKKLQLLWITNARKTHILLEKRPPQGIWGGLWSFPERPDGHSDDAERIDAHPAKDIKKRCPPWPSLSASDIKKTLLLPSGKHVFTHYTLHYRPLLIILKKQIPLPAASPYAWIAYTDIRSIGTHGLLIELLDKTMI